MSDIRINALATTATASASDDYVAIDGSANGTRKLSAYSPTFGGNLTVSGIASTFNTRLFINATSLNQFLGDGTGFGLSTSSFGIRNDQGNVVLAASGSAPQFTLTSTALSLTGNLTASGGTHTFGTANGGTYITTPGTAASTGTLYIQGGNASGSTAGGGVVLYGGSHASAPGWVRVGLAGTSKFAVNTSGLGSGTDVFTVDQAGNLTVSGTGTSSFGSGANLLSITPSTGIISFLSSQAIASIVVGNANAVNKYGQIQWLDSVSQISIGTQGQYGSGALNIATNGNSLFGTTTDSGNGKLQLATHTTSAGGIGFGTDTSLYRRAANVLAMTGALRLDSSVAYIELGGNAEYIERSGNTLRFATNSTTALTLDASQNATFAGDVTVSGGNLGVGSTATSIRSIICGGTLSGGTVQNGIYIGSAAGTDATSEYSGITIQPTASAGSYTIGSGYGISIATPSIGTSAAITTQRGLYIANQGVSGKTTNAYGIDIAAQSGASTTNVAIRAAGNVMFTSLPTSSAGLPAGSLWNDAGTLKIV